MTGSLVIESHRRRQYRRGAEGDRMPVVVLLSDFDELVLSGSLDPSLTKPRKWNSLLSTFSIDRLEQLHAGQPFIIIGT